jgi:hypothetical protein
MSTKINDSKQNKREVWEARIKAWGASGLSKSVFCKEQNITKSSFWKWYRRLSEKFKKNVHDIFFVPQPIPKSIASPGLLSHILLSKYADHLPLYRQEVILQRMGVDLLLATLCNWVLRCAEWMEPLVVLLKDMICQGSYVQADEAFLHVLNKPDKPNGAKSYMWIYRGGLPEKRSVVYEYQASRAGISAEKFLAGFEGVLQTDAYGD